jgi:hypothetical protein
MDTPLPPRLQAQLEEDRQILADRHAKREAILEKHGWDGRPWVHVKKEMVDGCMKRTRVTIYPVPAVRDELIATGVI